MRITRLAAVLLTLVFLLSCSSVEKEGALSYAPAQPTADGILSVEYHPDLSASPISDPASVKLRFTLMGAGGQQYSEALPMEKHGKSWKVDLHPGELLEVPPVIMVCAFLDGEDLERVDNRRGDPWRILFFEGGEPAMGAHFQEFRLLGGRERLAETLNVPRGREAATAALRRELELHPDHLTAQIREWSVLLSAAGEHDSLHAIVSGRLPALIEAQRPIAGEDLASMVGLYELLGETPRRDSLVVALAEEAPKSEAARLWALRDARGHDDPAERVRRLQTLMERFPDYETVDYDRGLVVYWCLTQANMPELAAEIVDERQPLDPDIGEYCAGLMRKRGDLDRALALLRHMRELREADPWTPAGLASREEAEAETAGMLAQNLFTQAQILVTQGVSREALPLLDEIVAAGPEHLDADILRALIDTEIRMERTENLVAHFELLLEHADPSSDELETWREHYGDDGNFISYLAQLRDANRQKSFEGFERHALRWPAPEVVFTDVDGAPLALADLRGKVVLLDFWATWCGPCRMALPGLNALAKDLADDDRFFVLPANTWERSLGAARHAAVAENWAMLGLDMPYYFDVEDGGESAPAVEQFGVMGIPSQFIIGKDGSILFKMVGYHGESGERELRQKIEWAMEIE